MASGWSPVSARRYYFTLLILIAAIILIFCQYRLSSGYDYGLYYSLLKNVINGDTCQLPGIDPFDESIKKYIIPASPLICKRLQPELTRLVDGRLLIDLNELAESGYSVDSVNCQYRCFSRVEDDDVTLEYGPWTPFSNGTFVNSCEFVEISCWKSFPPMKIYSNLHSQIIVKKDLIQKNKTKKPGILLFVLDSVSQSNWKRNLHRTLSVLETEYSSTVFQGFTKVGDNSFPNAVAFLAGIRTMTVGYEDELKSEDGFFDDWPIIWKEFKNESYATFYAEDYPEFNLFKYLANGFKHQPTDHYFRPFWLQLYGSFLHRRSTHLCYGNNPCHRIQIAYLEDFITKYAGQNVPIFALNWLTELGHDWLNQVAVGDEDISKFFTKMKPYLEDSFVFVFADHGHRFDPIRQSVIGRIEERMPFFSMNIPKFLKEKFPELESVMKENSRQLTSFWDLYATLKDVISLSRNDTWGDLVREDTEPRVLRGLSLLRPLPQKRNCESAGIPDDFCICQRENQITVNDSRVQKSAKAVIEKINQLLEQEIKQKKCVPLKLEKIEHAQTFLPNLKIATDSSGFYVMYRVTIVTSPSGGFFEGTVRHSVQSDGYTVTGDINRINKYSNQSTCVKSALLRKYCFCI